MWTVSLINNTNPIQSINFSDGLPLEAVRGGAGNSFRLIVNGFGFLDFTDTGHQPGGSGYWQLNLNGNIYWYDGQPAIPIIINNDGTFFVEGAFSGFLIPLPDLNSQDIAVMDWLMENNYVPYQHIPDEPGKTTEQLQALGLQYFPFTTASFELAMAVYDWTTADFTRIQFMQLFMYTDVSGCPLDMASIAGGIWSSNWGTYNPQNKDYMNEYMMQPAQSLQEVQTQLSQVVTPLRDSNDAEVRLLTAALSSLPRTSCLSVPMLYSGQVDISNLGTEHFATYFMEFPYNSNPGTPLQMPLSEALETFIVVGKTLTLKGLMSFTNSQQDAMHYSNGILVEVSPPAGSVVWENATYITPLSDGPEKIEYLYHPGSAFGITNIQTIIVSGKSIVQISVLAL
ncbi:MAG: hypothetical protein JWP69_1716 [Flaviaesturariibacter sp.]|nr:hypothetical protein [Flaviaesturariibacter sp.]